MLHIKHEQKHRSNKPIGVFYISDKTIFWYANIAVWYSNACISLLFLIQSVISKQFTRCFRMPIVGAKHPNTRRGGQNPGERGARVSCLKSGLPIEAHCSSRYRSACGSFSKDDALVTPLTGYAKPILRFRGFLLRRLRKWLAIVTAFRSFANHQTAFWEKQRGNEPFGHIRKINAALQPFHIPRRLFWQKWIPYFEKKSGHFFSGASEREEKPMTKRGNDKENQWQGRSNDKEKSITRQNQLQGRINYKQGAREKRSKEY